MDQKRPSKFGSNVVPFPDLASLDAAARNANHSSAAVRAQIRATLTGVRAAVQDLIDLLDEFDGDADDEPDEDVGADDLGEPDGAALRG